VGGHKTAAKRKYKEIQFKEMSNNGSSGRVEHIAEGDLGFLSQCHECRSCPESVMSEKL